MKQPSKDELKQWALWIGRNAHKTGFLSEEIHRPYYVGYADYVLPLIESEEIFDPARANMPWHEYNTRSPWAVLGTAEELNQIIRYNNFSASTKMYRSDGGKEAEMRGEDTCVFNPNWKQPYTNQAKHGTTSFDGILRIPARWFKYDPNKLHRFSVSNHEEEWAFMVGYGAFKTFVEANYPCTGDVTYRYYEVPVLDLRKNQELRFMSF